MLVVFLWFYNISYNLDFLKKAYIPNTTNRPKLCINCAFPQNFLTKKLGEITVFYVVQGSSLLEQKKVNGVNCDVQTTKHFPSSIVCSTRDG